MRKIITNPLAGLSVFGALLLSLLVVSGGASAHHLNSTAGVPLQAGPSQLSEATVAFKDKAPQVPIAVKRVELSASPALQARVQAVLNGKVRALTVGFQHRHAVQVSRIRLHPNKLELVGHRMVQSSVSAKNDSAAQTPTVRVWFEEVTLTIPRQYLSGSWDVLSLEKELERLGINIKPKPTAPKPTAPLAG